MLKIAVRTCSNDDFGLCFLKKIDFFGGAPDIRRAGLEADLSGVPPRLSDATKQSSQKKAAIFL